MVQVSFDKDGTLVLRVRAYICNHENIMKFIIIIFKNKNHADE